MVSEKPNWLSGGFRTYCNSWAGSGYALLPVGRISPTVAVFCATFGDIFVSESPDMVYWGKHRHVMGKGSEWWESLKIGGGAAPIETDEGWLLFYHGVTGTCNGYVYSIGGAILDIEGREGREGAENFLLTLACSHDIMLIT